MGRLKLQMQVTVDGFDPVGQDDDVAWDEIRDYSLGLLEGAGTIVLGRKTAVEFIPYWDAAAREPGGSWHGVAQRIAQARKVVFSTGFDDPGWDNTTIETGSLAAAIERLKQEDAGDIIVYGGISFVAALVQARLIDEYHLFVNPVAAGSGRSIFAGMAGPLKLKLRKAIGFAGGHALLHYE